MKEYTVYWYRRPEYTNPYTQGYIGITKNMKKRNQQHLSSKVVTHFTNALKAYQDITYEVLHSEITLEEASDLEYAYRPSTNIGWNSAIGGMDTLSTMRTPITLYHETNPELLYPFKSVTEASAALDISIGRIVQARLRGKQQYGYDGWAILLDENLNRDETKSVSEVLSIALTGQTHSKPSHFKGMKNRWTEEQKQEISKVHKGKTISQEHRDALSTKNSKNPNLCKKVTLKHKDSEQEFTFFSISEASKQLNIPLSRLKSKAQRTLSVYGKDGWAITNLGS